MAEKRPDLDPLPPTKSEYWDHAETNLIELEEFEKCDHKFFDVGNDQVECEKCLMGFYMTPGWYLKEGHIYCPEGFVI